MEQPARILLVVGDPTSRSSVERAVATAGHALHSLSIGDGRLREGTFGEPAPLALIALVDLSQADELRALRAEPALSALPLLLAMQGDASQVFALARELGADAVCRDLSEEELCARLVRMLRDDDTRRELARKERDAHLALELTRELQRLRADI